MTEFLEATTKVMIVCLALSSLSVFFVLLLAVFREIWNR